MSQLGSGPELSVSLNKYINQVIETCNEQMALNLKNTGIENKKYKMPLLQVLMCKEIYKFMAENKFELKLPYTGSPVEKLQLELFMNISESNPNNEALLNAIELVEYSREQEDVCDIIETFDNQEQKIVPWLMELACLKNQIFNKPESGRLFMSGYDKYEMINHIFAHHQPYFPIDFECQDISPILNREILEILTPTQLRFLADYKEGIKDLNQLRLEYEQKRMIRAIVNQKRDEQREKEKRLEDLFPKPSPVFDYPQSEWPANDKNKNWFEPISSVSNPVFSSGGVAVEEGTSLEQLFATFKEIYKKDFSAELQASAIQLAQYTNLTDTQIANMDLTLDDIDQLTTEARYIYAERATILKRIEIAKKMREI